jgi:hypothetical protein
MPVPDENDLSQYAEKYTRLPGEISTTYNSAAEFLPTDLTLDVTNRHLARSSSGLPR